MSNLISVVIPVYNEEESLPKLFDRLLPVMENLKRPFEIIFINDGSKDSSLKILLEKFQQHKNIIRVIDLNGNFGQHMAIMSGFKKAKGDFIITMDADLQNPPEEIPNIISFLEKGHDVVGTIRQKRQDTFFRRYASKLVNKIMSRITGFAIHDYGCMLRGYNREIINIINESQEISTFIPALAQKFSVNPVEIEVAHSAREAGESKYSLFKLIRLQFDLMTAFSIFPLQVMTPLGVLIFFAGIFWGVNVLLGGLIITCLGILGEYVGRIYQEVRKRPRFVIRKFYSD